MPRVPVRPEQYVGGLGPDLERDETQAARERLDKRLAFARGVQKTAAALPKRAEKPAQKSRAEALREKRLAYARAIAPPAAPAAPRVPEPDAVGPDEYPAGSDADEPPSDAARISEMLAQHDQYADEVQDLYEYFRACGRAAAAPGGVPGASSGAPERNKYFV